MVKMDQRVKTLAANAAIEAAQKKKENPYLAHKAIVPGNASVVPGLANVPGMAGLLISAVFVFSFLYIYVCMPVCMYVCMW